MSQIVTKTARNIISIPFKIKRSPTDLLKALSNTVELDASVPNYSLIDDTILGSSNQFDKKKNLLSKVSGIKAAQFMMEKYPQAFMKDDCVPHVPSFFPTKTFSEEELKYPSEDLIYSLMSWGKIKLAYDTYLRCKDQNIEVTEACKLSLLDFLCIYNSSDYVPKKPILEEWYENDFTAHQLDRLGKLNLQSTWRKTGEAHLMFDELKEKSSQAYCSLIKGMAKYLELTSSIKLYEEMKKKNLIPDLNTYNELLKLYRYSNESAEKKTYFLMHTLNDMKNYGVRPNLHTFNNCLGIVQSFGYEQEAICLALNILKEMEMLNIEPSLATWSKIIRIFYPIKDVGKNTHVLEQVLDQLEKMNKANGGIEWRDIEDNTFFIAAVEACYSIAENSKLIHRLHALLMKNNNVKFLNDEDRHKKYFEIYIMTLIKYESPEVLFREWRNLTPYLLSRTSRLVGKMVDYIYDYKCFEYVPEIWTNFIELKARKNTEYCNSVIKLLVNLMAEYQENDSMMQNYGSIAELMITTFPYLEIRKPRALRIDQEALSPLEYQWTGKMLSDFFIVAIKANKLDLVIQEYDKFMNNSHLIMGEISEHSIKELFRFFMNSNRPNEAMKVLNQAVLYQLSSLVKQFLEELKNLKNLNEEQKQLIKDLNKKF